jgi:hypothetical protein
LTRLGHPAIHLGAEMARHARNAGCGRYWQDLTFANGKNRPTLACRDFLAN